ncbi:MAG: phosphoglucosamine mutase, partial [Succinivibrio sp.]|nr:phosphoglucosamine mutase [Succinivibrio sp.]
IELANAQDFGRAFRQDDAPGRYIEYCKSTFNSSMNLDGMKIVLDCANGATYHIAPQVFRELGAEVITIGDKPNGININDGVGSTHPEALVAKVLATKADLGIAFDGDGDRVLMCDSKGVLRDGDNLLYVIAKDTNKRGRLNGGVVGTLMTNLGLEIALGRENIPFSRAKVGDRYVLEQLVEKGWKLGGENSGHIICLNHATTGDGIVSALQVLKACINEGKDLIEMSAGLEMFPQDLINVRMTTSIDVTTDEAVQKEVAAVEKELGNKGRVLLRKSGTEPVVRVMVEGEDKDDVHNKAQRIADVIIRQSGC